MKTTTKPPFETIETISLNAVTGGCAACGGQCGAGAGPGARKPKQGQQGEQQ